MSAMTLHGYDNDGAGLLGAEGPSDGPAVAGAADGTVMIVEFERNP